jgi:hypothetical protein
MKNLKKNASRTGIQEARNTTRQAVSALSITACGKVSRGGK